MITIFIFLDFRLVSCQEYEMLPETREESQGPELNRSVAGLQGRINIHTKAEPGYYRTTRGKKVT